MSGVADGWDASISAWAHAQGDIKALVQIGSRVQEGAVVDPWSDYDYQLITTEPGKYRDGSFCREIGPCWVSGSHVAFGNSLKITAVYEGALEADFIVLKSMDVAIATLALRWPGTEHLWPRVLRRGVADLRIVVGPGWRMVKGGAAWERRYSRINPLRPEMTGQEFAALCCNFWAQAVWAAKKAQRGEFRASQRGIHEHLAEGCLRILQEEAILAGRKAYPLGRRAETWLTQEQLGGTASGTRPDRAALLAAVGEAARVFSASSAAVAAARGWSLEEAAQVRAWLASSTGTGTAPR
ncbi:MAG TPA: hypothetical protein VII43_05525 [Opitutaceae bacterium]